MEDLDAIHHILDIELLTADSAHGKERTCLV